MSDDREQDTLVAGSVNTNTLSGTVWVVTVRKDGDPHSHVEAVYAGEDAANAHKKYIADNSFQVGAIAWGVHERELQAAFNGGESE